MAVELTRPANRVAGILYAVLGGGIPRVPYLQGILDAHGWPDLNEVRAMADQLNRLGDLDVTFEVEEVGRCEALRRRSRDAVRA